MPVAEPVAGVLAVPGHAAGLGLPVGQQDALDAQPAQLGGGGQPGRAGADDQDVHDIHDVHVHGVGHDAGAPVENSLLTRAAQ